MNFLWVADLETLVEFCRPALFEVGIRKKKGGGSLARGFVFVGRMPFVVHEERPPKTTRNKFEEQIRTTANVKDRDPRLVRSERVEEEHRGPPGVYGPPRKYF